MTEPAANAWPLTQGQRFNMGTNFQFAALAALVDGDSSQLKKSIAVVDVLVNNGTRGSALCQK